MTDRERVGEGSAGERAGNPTVGKGGRSNGM